MSQWVSVLFSEPKISQPIVGMHVADRAPVSVLFSEPKISQPRSHLEPVRTGLHGFSALQRAENFSTQLVHEYRADPSLFQCSSASRKFLNAAASQRAIQTNSVSVLFSEPKISQLLVVQRPELNTPAFQCSSASRKFLNHRHHSCDDPAPAAVSVLFSEPKISQPDVSENARKESVMVSVLFSEPKISQPSLFRTLYPRLEGFSALQRAENFSTRQSSKRTLAASSVSVLFSEPKISQLILYNALLNARRHVSVLFSEPKISQPLRLIL